MIVPTEFIIADKHPVYSPLACAARNVSVRRIRKTIAPGIIAILSFLWCPFIAAITTPIHSLIRS